MSSSLVFVPLVFVTSCNSDDNSIVANKQQVILEDSDIVINQKVLSEMIDKYTSHKTRGVISDDEVWSIINASFRIRKDGEVIPVQEYFKTLNMNVAETKDFILGKIFLFENPYMPQTRAGKPSLEEVRNAMLEECENGYFEPISSACKMAVKLAYYYHKSKA